MNSKQKGNFTTGHMIGVCAVSVVATLIVGFTWGGWVTSSSAATMTKKSTDAAVATRLGKICMAQANLNDDIATQLEEIQKTAAYNRTKIVMDKPWAIMPGEEKVEKAVASACLDELIKT